VAERRRVNLSREIRFGRGVPSPEFFLIFELKNGEVWPFGIFWVLFFIVRCLFT